MYFCDVKFEILIMVISKFYLETFDLLPIFLPCTHVVDIKGKFLNLPSRELAKANLEGRQSDPPIHRSSGPTIQRSDSTTTRMACNLMQGAADGQGVTDSLIYRYRGGARLDTRTRSRSPDPQIEEVLLPLK